MPTIRPISDLRNSANEISVFAIELVSQSPLPVMAMETWLS